MVGYKNEQAENWKEHANTLNRTPMKAAKIWIALNHMPGGDDSCWGGADGQLDELESGDDSGLDDKALLGEFNEPEPVEAPAQRCERAAVNRAHRLPPRDCLRPFPGSWEDLDPRFQHRPTTR